VPGHAEAWENARRAERRLGLPSDLWLDIGLEFATSNLRHLLDNYDGDQITSAFMAGVAVGWAEKSGKIK